MSKIKKEESNKQKNKSVSEELLNSVRNALYKLKDHLDNIEFNQDDDINEQTKKVQSILSTAEKLGKAIETMVILEKKVAQEESANSRIRGNAKLSLLEDGSID